MFVQNIILALNIIFLRLIKSPNELFLLILENNQITLCPLGHQHTQKRMLLADTVISYKFKFRSNYIK